MMSKEKSIESKSIDKDDIILRKDSVDKETWQNFSLLQHHQLSQEIFLCFSAIIAIQSSLDLVDQDENKKFQLNIYEPNKQQVIKKILPIDIFADLQKKSISILELCKKISIEIESTSDTISKDIENLFLVEINCSNTHLTSLFKENDKNYPLAVSISFEQTPIIKWFINKNFFKEETINSLLKIQKKIILQIAKLQEETVLPDFLSDNERNTRDLVNQTSLNAIDNLLIHQSFFEYAEKNPQKTALFWEFNQQKNHLSYGSLANSALKLSAFLVKKGIQSYDNVAVILPKGHSQIIAVMGILASGAVYVPIGIDQPLKRQEKIFKQAKIKFIVTESSTIAGDSHLRELAEKEKMQIITIEQTHDIAPLKSPVLNDPSNLAYIIFTSGSTGEPKGVEITHESAWNTIQDINNKFNVCSEDIALTVSALDFDLSVYDIFGLLSVGGSLVLIQEQERKEASIWVQLIENYKVTLWNSVPALFDMLLVSSSLESDISSLRLVLVSGDWVGLDLLDRMKLKSPDCQLVALGGATEASIWSNFFKVEKIEDQWNSIPYGKPLANQKYRVVNSIGRDCPNHVIGELWIGGKGIAKGYTSNEKLTQHRFVQVNDEYWYRTGDLGRYLEDGNLEFLGRIDHQVKVNGFRIELGEIESTLRDCSGVSQATANVLSLNGSKYIVAGVVSGSLNHSIKNQNKVKNNAKIDEKILNSQKYIVAKFLIEMLALNDLIKQSKRNESEVDLEISAVQIEQLKQNLQNSFRVTPEQMPVIDMWIYWFIKEKLIISINEKLFFSNKFLSLAKNSIDDKHSFEKFENKFNEWIALFHKILSGSTASVVILQEELLSPELLSAKDINLLKGIDIIAQKVNEVSQERNLKVAILGGGLGVLTEKLLRSINNENIEFIVIDEGRSKVKNFTKNLNELGFNITGVELKNNYIPEEYWYQFDFVIAINSLHRFKDPKQGGFLSNILLKQRGRLLALESEDLIPISLLNAGVIERGFDDYDSKRKEIYNPMLNQLQWQKYFFETGYDEFHAENINKTLLILMDVECSKDRAELKESFLLKHLKNFLPAHMIPERISLLPSLPLSSNGKVDQKKFTTIVKALLEDHFRSNRENIELPLDGTEQKIANIWKDLLDIPNIDRNDVFFEIGGDSLSATQFLTEVKKEFQLDIALREIFGVSLKEIAAQLDIKLKALQEELANMEVGEI